MEYGRGPWIGSGVGSIKEDSRESRGRRGWVWVRTRVVMAAEASKKRVGGCDPEKTIPNRLYKKAVRIPKPKSVNISGLRLWIDFQKNFRMGKPKYRTTIDDISN